MAKQQTADEQQEPSRAAGGCVLAALGGGAFAVLFAWSDAAGILTVWLIAAAAVWWAASRRVSDSSATPPPEEGRPLCRECTGHELVEVAPSRTQKGMLIYKTQPPGKPHHTHIHVAAGEVTDDDPMPPRRPRLRVLRRMRMVD